MPSIAVIYNKKPAIRSKAERIIRFLKNAGVTIKSPQHKDVEFLLALGGDGTILHAVDSSINHNLPILSVCLGKIGFLSELLEKEAISGVQKALNKKYKLDSRHMLKAEVYRNHKKIHTGYALNDVVVSNARFARIVDIATMINGTRTAKYRADGVIVCTATGSTAYNLSAGGTILPPSRKELIITPICPHLLNWKSQLITPSKTITLKVNFHKKQTMVLTFDGQKHVRLLNNDEIKITLSQKKVDFIRFKPYNFQKLLKQKLSGK